MKRLIFVLLAAVALAGGAQVASAHDSVDFAVTFGNGYYAPQPAYWESRPYWEAPPAYVATRPVYVEREYIYRPRVIHARHVCPPGFHYMRAHYSYRWHHWQPGYCRHW